MKRTAIELPGRHSGVIVDFIGEGTRNPAYGFCARSEKWIPGSVRERPVDSPGMTRDLEIERG